MKSLDVMERLSDLSMKQLVFFYELCKAGVVRFDMGNPVHAVLLRQMHMMMQRNMDMEACSDLEKAQKGARTNAYAAILYQIVSHAVKRKTGGILK